MMDKTLLIVFLLAAFTTKADHGDSLETDKPELIIEQLDNMISGYLSDKSIFATDTAYLRKSVNPTFPDSVYKKRIAIFPRAIPYTYNHYVKSFIDLYAVKRRAQVNKMLGLATIYYPIFEEILDKYDMPLELKHLAVVESALNTSARSRVGATGLWQFMYGTGKQFGLKVTTYTDDRRDPYLATDAAARFLSGMYKIYKDWLLVIAAYNCGPGRVNRAIRRSGKTDFWSIRRYLPRETRGYVPAFIAASYVMTYHEQHNLHPVEPMIKNMVTEKVLVTNYIDIKKAAPILGLNEDLLSFFNPRYKLMIVPGTTTKPFDLVLPLEKISLFEQFEDSIYATSKYLTKTDVPELTTRIASNDPSLLNTKGKKLIYYKVRSGDNLGFIAEKFHCRAQDIRNWNNMYGSRIYVGKNLKIYVRGSVPTTNTASSQSYKIDPNTTYIDYVVKYGDTLWDIVKLFPGVTIDQIKLINKIINSKSIKPGMILKLPKSS